MSKESTTPVEKPWPSRVAHAIREANHRIVARIKPEEQIFSGAMLSAIGIALMHQSPHPALSLPIIFTGIAMIAHRAGISDLLENSSS